MNEPTPEQLEEMRGEAVRKLREAEQAWHRYAAALPVGMDRVNAFLVYENVRVAARIG